MSGFLPSPGLQSLVGLENTSDPSQPAQDPSFTSFQRVETESPTPSPEAGMLVGGGRLAGPGFLCGPKAESRADSSPSFRKRGNSNSFLPPRGPPGPAPLPLTTLPRLLRSPHPGPEHSNSQQCVWNREFGPDVQEDAGVQEGVSGECASVCREKSYLGVWGMHSVRKGKGERRAKTRGVEV